MQFKDLSRILAIFIFGFALVMAIPLFVSCYYKLFIDPVTHPQDYAIDAFLVSIGICLLLGFFFYYQGKRSTRKLYQKEGIAAVVVLWVLIPALAALPFLISGTLKNPFQAYFEMASGFTTTGASIMTAKTYDMQTGEEIPIIRTFCGSPDVEYRFYGTIEPIRDPISREIVLEGVEAVGKGLLFWRSLTQWLGGVGIVVLFIAILPALGAGGRILFQAEVPGPLKDSMTPRIKEAAMQLWRIYCGLTAIQVVLLLATNPQMSLFDAVTISFSTLSTGGFSVRNTSIEYYHNSATEWIVLIFMIFGGINFTLYFYILRGKFYRIYEPEFFCYLAVILIGAIFAAWQLVGTPYVLLDGSIEGNFTMGNAIRHGMFQTVSTQTSTGFATANYDSWPYILQTLMLILMFVGGMSGSTAGGIKIMRHYMLFRIAQTKVESLFRPYNVQTFRVADKEVDVSVSTMVLCFFLILITLSVIGTFVYILDGIDPQTSLGLVGCTINNVGLAFRMASPANSFAFMSDFSLMWSSLLMIAGRLEFFVVLAVLVPAFWKKT
jgi:trk system potassium uptake protein TrkH